LFTFQLDLEVSEQPMLFYLDASLESLFHGAHRIVEFINFSCINLSFKMIKVT